MISKSSTKETYIKKAPKELKLFYFPYCLYFFVSVFSISIIELLILPRVLFVSSTLLEFIVGLFFFIAITVYVKKRRRILYGCITEFKKEEDISDSELRIIYHYENKNGGQLVFTVERS